MRQVLIVELDGPPKSVPSALQGRELILLDSNILILLSRSRKPAWIFKSLMGWRGPMG